MTPTTSKRSFTNFPIQTWAVRTALDELERDPLYKDTQVVKQYVEDTQNLIEELHNIIKNRGNTNDGIKITPNALLL